MRIDLGRFIKKRGDYDNENIICPIEDYHRDKYLNKRLFIRVLFMLAYCYNFGGLLVKYESIDDIKIVIMNFIFFYVISFYLIQIPHEFIHTIFYKNPFKNKKNSLVFFNKKRIVTSELNEYTHPIMMCISLIMPFLLFSIGPLIVIKYLGFDLYLYSLSFANAILSSDDLLNIILQLFVRSNENGYNRLFVIPNNYDYLLEDNDINENIENAVLEDDDNIENAALEHENSVDYNAENIALKEENYVDNSIESTVLEECNNVTYDDNLDCELNKYSDEYLDVESDKLDDLSVELDRDCTEALNSTLTGDLDNEYIDDLTVELVNCDENNL